MIWPIIWIADSNMLAILMVPFIEGLLFRSSLYSNPVFNNLNFYLFSTDKVLPAVATFPSTLARVVNRQHRHEKKILLLNHHNSKTYDDSPLNKVNVKLPSLTSSHNNLWAVTSWGGKVLKRRWTTWNGDNLRFRHCRAKDWSRLKSRWRARL